MRFAVLALAFAATSVVAGSCDCNTDKVQGKGGCDWDVEGDNCNLCYEDGISFGDWKAPDCTHNLRWGKS